MSAVNMPTLPHASNRHSEDGWTRRNRNRPRLRESRPITLGHPKERQTQLPARDADPHGGITRSNRFPNCTYMTQWTAAPEDRITWDVEVIQGGTFEVVMYYACPQGERWVGDRIELWRSEASRQPSRSPMRFRSSAAEHDRVKRQEGYVKDWRPDEIGRD